MSVNWLGKQSEYEVRGNRWLQTDGKVQGNNETGLTSVINHNFHHVEKKMHFGVISAKHILMYSAWKS